MNNSIEQIKQLKELFECEFKPVDGICITMYAKDKLILEMADNMIKQHEVKPSEFMNISSYKALSKGDIVRCIKILEMCDCTYKEGECYEVGDYCDKARRNWIDFKKGEGHLPKDECFDEYFELVTMDNIKADEYAKVIDETINDHRKIGKVLSKERKDSITCLKIDGEKRCYYNERLAPCLPPTEEKEYIKPPLGLRSKFIVDEHRIAEIEEAMHRYFVEDKEVPDEWQRELDILKGKFVLYSKEDWITATQSIKDENEYLRGCVDKLTFSIDKVKKTEYAKGFNEAVVNSHEEYKELSEFDLRRKSNEELYHIALTRRKGRDEEFHDNVDKFNYGKGFYEGYEQGLKDAQVKDEDYSDEFKEERAKLYADAYKEGHVDGYNQAIDKSEEVLKSFKFLKIR